MADVQHLVSRELGSGIEMMFHVSDFEADETYQYYTSRNAIGVSFPARSRENSSEYCFACVAGERIFESRGHNGAKPERTYSILDERQANGLNELLTACIELKDKWIAHTVYCPSEPRALVESIRTTEGLTFYRKDRVEQECRKRWSSFVEMSCTAGINEMQVPGDESVHGDLDALLSVNAMDPDGDGPILDDAGQAVPRLYVFQELTTDKSWAGLQRGMGDPQVCKAIWLAVHGMDQSMPRFKRDPMVEDDNGWKPAKHSGY